jgi:hypothetical protein
VPALAIVNAGSRPWACRSSRWMAQVSPSLVIFGGERVAVGRGDIDPGEHGLRTLKEFIMQVHLDAGEPNAGVDGYRPLRGLLECMWIVPRLIRIPYMSRISSIVLRTTRVQPS